jgi:hypothetical protein
VSEAVFTRAGDRFLPTAHARGPWDPGALHGGAPAALITSAFEAFEPSEELRIARLGFELLRPIPAAALSLSVHVVRPGRRVQELAAELHGEGELICRASALRVQAVPKDLPEAAAPTLEAMAGPEECQPVDFTLDDGDTPGFAATAMEMRSLADPRRLGPARVWMRMRLPLTPGQPASPLALAAATADVGNGVSAVLPFAEFIFINADLGLHLHRAPRGEWIGLDARTLLLPGGAGLSESVVHDVDGPVGRAFQTLVVQPR